MSTKPCNDCSRRGRCNRKDCQTWQIWFLGEWKKFNNYYNKYKDNQEVQKDGK